MDCHPLILRFLSLLTACLLVSCIDGREEIWLNADGSGRADVSYTVPVAAATFQGGEAGIRRMIEDFLQATPEISSSTCEVATLNDRLTIRVTAEFDSASNLGRISQGASLEKLPSSADGLTGEFQVSQKWLTVDFSRKITAGTALPGSSFMPGTRFANRNLTYIVHLPAAASESNATRTENDGRTLVWDYPLATAIQGPIFIRFKAPIPIPFGWVATAIAIFLLLVFLVIRGLRRTLSGNLVREAVLED